ncbi:MAG: hypothetical protein MJ252_00855 [archaeon]|nr:hypothetical protein [archaeon]
MKKESIQERLKKLKQAKTMSSPDRKRTTSEKNLSSLLLEKKQSANISLDENKLISSPKRSIPLSLTEDSESNNLRNEMNSALKSGEVSNEKFASFIQKATNMFQSYETELYHLKKNYGKFTSTKLGIDQSNKININYIASQRQIFQSKLTEILSENTDLSQKFKKVQNEYEQKISALFKENENLSKILGKMSNEVICELQKKISELTGMTKERDKENAALKEKIRTVDSIFAQVNQLRDDLKEKDEELTELNQQQIKSMKKIEELSKRIIQLQDEISNYISTISKKDEEIKKLNETITALNNSNSEKEKIIDSKTDTIKEKENEIQLLFNDNVQWEEKYSIQTKEIESFKKWSMWDMSQIEAFRKIDLLTEDLGKTKSENKLYLDENTHLKERNSFLTENLDTEKKKNNELTTEVESLSLIKIKYNQLEKDLEDYMQIKTDNAKMKKELKEINENYESQIKTSKKNYESQIETNQKNFEIQLKNQEISYENKIKEINLTHEDNVKKLEEEINQKETEIKNLNNHNSEIQEQLFKKSELFQNIKDIYESTIEKVKEQEEKIRNLEKNGPKKSDDIFGDEETNTSNEGNSETQMTQPVQTKMYSTFNKYSFTKELLKDYYFVIYLFDHALSIQNVIASIITNMDGYMSNLFLRKDNLNFYFNIQLELLEDIFFISFDKILSKQCQNFFSNDEEKKKIKIDFYKINFENFDKSTIEQIVEEIFNYSIIKKLKTSKTLEQLSNGIIKRYQKKFDFDENLGDFVKKEIYSDFENNIDKYKKKITDDIKSLVELSLHNLKEGILYHGTKEIYSFEKYFAEYYNININYEKKKIIFQRETISNEQLDAVYHMIKSNNFIDISFINCFSEKSADNLYKILKFLSLHAPNIKSLTLNDNSGINGDFFIKKIVPIIQQFKDLAILILTKNCLNDEEIKALCEYLKNNKTVKYLSLADNQITTTSGYFFADALVKNKTIEILILNRNEVNDGGLTTMLNALKNNNKSIKMLNLGDNDIQEEDFNSLVEYLNSNPPLTQLDISGNHIHPTTANTLGVALKKASHLESFLANRCGLNDDTTPILLNFLQSCSISHLEIDMNLFTDMGNLVIANKIKSCVNLKKISLRECQISNIFLDIISQALITSHHLEELNFEGNTFDEKGFSTFCMKMQNNKDVIVKFSKNMLPKNAEAIVGDLKNIILN